MYSGADKYSGNVVGQEKQATDLSCLEQVIETSSAEETIEVNVPYDAGDGTVKVQTVLLKAKLNPDGGGLQWIQEDDTTSSYNTVVAMSQMTSMLRDLDRNRKYEMMIKNSIHNFKSEHGYAPVVLDIGTGTGLLAMMAARHGAEKVYACELFPVLSEIARNITSANFTKGKIQVISKRSTSLVTDATNPDCFDVPQAVDIVVSEIFDSALLGEGVLPTIRHALGAFTCRATGKPPLILPGKATIYGQLASCSSMYFRRRFRTSKQSRLVSLARNHTANSCIGDSRAFPVHLASLERLGYIKYFTNPFEAKTFDFSLSTSEAIHENSSSVLCIEDGIADCVIFWWKVDFDNGTQYSTYPGVENWQDHWVQMVYPLSASITVQDNAMISVKTIHDDFNVSFEVAIGDSTCNTKKLDAFDTFSNQCTCGLHLICNSERIGVLNDITRTSAFVDAITSVITSLKASGVACLDISDGSLCALVAAAAGCKTITSIESKAVSCRIFSQIAIGNGHDETIQFLETGCKGIALEHLNGSTPINLLMAEPFYYSMQNIPILEAINFWVRRSSLKNVLSDDCIVLPTFATIRAVIVEFEHLHSCFGEVAMVMGFDHTHLDSIQSGWQLKDYPFPLWMYNFRKLSNEVEVMRLDYTKSIFDIRNTVQIPILAASGVPHAIVTWVDYDLLGDGKHIVSTGPESVNYKQSVRFFGSDHLKYEAASDRPTSFTLETSLQASTADFEFNVTKSM